MSGLYYEEFEVGMEFKHALTRTVTEMDNIMFSALTHNPQPLHLDAEFSKNTMYGKQLVNSIFTLGLVIGVSVGDTTLGTTLGNLGMTEVRFINPVFHGDTLYAYSQVTDKSDADRDDAGIVQFHHWGVNDKDQIVFEGDRRVLLKRRSHWVNAD